MGLFAFDTHLHCSMSQPIISKKRKFVADGVFYAELHELLVRELAEDGYSGVEVRQTPARHEIIIRATRTQNVLGEKGRRIRELTAVVQWLRQSHSATSFSVGSLFAGLAMVCCVSLWKMVPWDVKLSYRASSELSEQRA